MGGLTNPRWASLASKEGTLTKKVCRLEIFKLNFSAIVVRLRTSWQFYHERFGHFVWVLGLIIVNAKLDTVSFSHFCSLPLFSILFQSSLSSSFFPAFIRCTTDRQTDRQTSVKTAFQSEIPFSASCLLTFDPIQIYKNGKIIALYVTD